MILKLGQKRSIDPVFTACKNFEVVEVSRNKK